QPAGRAIGRRPGRLCRREDLYPGPPASLSRSPADRTWSVAPTGGRVRPSRHSPPHRRALRAYRQDRPDGHFDRSREVFLDFLDLLDASVAKGQVIHLVLDNLNTYGAPRVYASLARRPRPLATHI